MKVFFDASVIIASLLSPTGGSSQLFKFIKAGIITGFTSENVLEEILEERKFIKLNKTRQEIEGFTAQSGLIIREKVTEDEIKPFLGEIDKDDAHLIAAAKHVKCHYLVSLDKKHVLKIEVRKKFLPLIIVSPKELLQVLVK